MTLNQCAEIIVLYIDNSQPLLRAVLEVAQRQKKVHLRTFITKKAVYILNAANDPITAMCMKEALYSLRQYKTNEIEDVWVWISDHYRQKLEEGVTA